MVDGGAATGATALRITNQAGPGAKTTGDGIQVVQAINGGTTAPGAFTSGGIYAGAYSYMLFRGGVTPGTEQNWYLRSELTPVVDPKPIYRPGVSIYTEVPSLARELAVQQIGTFHDRQGNQDLLTGAGRLPAAGRAPGAIISERRDGTVSQSFSGNVFGMQAGQDLYARVGDSGHQDRYGVFWATRAPTATCAATRWGNAATAPASSPSIPTAWAAIGRTSGRAAGTPTPSSWAAT